MERLLGISDYIVVDVETPNSRGNSICSIGIIIVKNYQVSDTIYTLINPEDRFDHRNQDITGLHASMVQNSPTLKEFWPRIKEIMESNIIVGHNILFDLSVISKSLHRYDIETIDFNYICTLELSQIYIDSDSYKLSNLVSFIGYEYEEHKAIEDAKAAHSLFRFISDNFGIGKNNIHTYHFKNILYKKLDSRLESNLNQLYGIITGIVADEEVNEDEIQRLNRWVEENYKYKQYALFNKVITALQLILKDNRIDEFEKIELKEICHSIHHSKMYNETTLGIQIVQGILDGIIADEKINIKEIRNLEKWLKIHDYLTGVYPYDRIVKTVDNVLLDGILDEQEITEMKTIFNEILNPIEGNNRSIELKGKTYCLSGEFKTGTKADIRRKLDSFGAIEKKGVSSKTDYLFVGGVGSDAWKHGNFGSKVSKAQELQEKGCKIAIIGEDDLIKVI